MFKKVGVEVTPENRREMAKVIHYIVGAEHKDCPAIWKEVKKRIVEDEKGFVLELREAWTSHVRRDEL